MTVAQAAGPATYKVELPAQLLRTALPAIKDQTGLTFWLSSSTEPGEMHVPRLSGEFTADSLAEHLLAGSGWTYQFVPSLGYELCQRVCDSGTPVQAVPEVLIKGTASLNMDIARTRDDYQSYAVIDSVQIRRNHASSAQEMIRQLIPSASRPATTGALADVTGESNQIELRGASRGQTIVLLDGRRIVPHTFGGDVLQSDIAIPTEAIGRIEVHGTTSSARFGGNATMGSVNIIQRRNDPGLRFSFTGDVIQGAPSSSKDLFGDWVTLFADGRGRFSMWANYALEPQILRKDRDVVTRGREKVSANNRDNPQSIAAPWLTERTTVLSATGASLIPGSQVLSLTIPIGWNRSKGLQALLPATDEIETGLAHTAQSQGGAYSAVRPRTEKESASMSVQFQLTSNVSTDAELAVGKVERNAAASGADFLDYRRVRIEAGPQNPFGQPVWVTAPLRSGDAEMRSDYRIARAMAGVQTQFADDWSARLEYAASWTEFSLDRPVFDLPPNVIASGAIDVFRDPIDESLLGSSLGTLSLSKLRSGMGNASLLLAGSLWKLPAGVTKLTLLFEHRNESLVDHPARTTLFNPAVSGLQIRSVIPEQSSRVNSVYSELNIPLLASARRPSSAPLLQGRLTLRGDDYNVDTARLVQGSFDEFEYSASSFKALSWMAELHFEPITGLSLRGGLGTGFMPPANSDITLPVQQLLASPFFRDPARNFEPIGPFLLIAGGNPDLKPERSRNYTVGILVEPPGIEGLRFSADFTEVSKTRGIFSPSSGFFTNPGAYILDMPTRVMRAPLEPGDPNTAGRITAIDVSSLNVSETELRAWDFALDYAFPATRFGTFRFAGLASIEPELSSKLTPTASRINDAGVASLAPPRQRSTLSLVWENGQWAAGWTTRLVSHYRVSRSLEIQADQGGPHVSSQNYSDAWVSYSFEGKQAFTGDVEVQAGAKNVFQKLPPLDAADPSLASRLGSYELPGFYLKFRMHFGSGS